MSNPGKLFALALYLFLSVSAFAQTDIQTRINTLITEGDKDKENGKFAEATELFTQALNLSKKNNQKGNEAVALGRIAQIRYLKGEYKKADSIYNSVFELFRKANVNSGIQYAQTIHDRAELYMAMENYSQSEKLFKEAIELRKKELGETHPDCAASMLNLSYLYLGSGRFKESEGLLTRASEILEVQEEQWTDHQILLYTSFGYFFMFSKQDLSLAEDSFKKAITIAKFLHGTDHPVYANCLMAIMACYNGQMKYDKVLEVYGELEPLMNKYFGENHPWNPGILVSLIPAYQQKGNYRQAELTLLKCMDICRKTLGEDHSYYLMALTNLGVLYMETGNQQRAEEVLIEKLEKMTRKHGKSNRRILSDISNLGNFYYSIGKYADAEKYLAEAYSMLKPEDMKLQIANKIVHNLAVVYSLQNYINRVVRSGHPEFVQQMQELKEKYPEYYDLVMDKGLVNLSVKDESVAENMFLEVLSHYESTIGKLNATYITALANLANHYMFCGKYEKAENIYQDGAELLEQMGNANKLLNINFLKNRALNYEKIGKITEAGMLFTQAMEIMKNHMNSNFAYFSEEERELFWNHYGESMDYYKAFACRHSKTHPSLSILAFDMELFSASLLLNSSGLVQQSILQSGNQKLISDWGKVKEIKKKLTDVEELINKMEITMAQSLSLVSTQNIGEAVSRSDNQEIINTYAKIVEVKERYVKEKQSLQLMEKEIMDQSPLYRQQLQNYALKWTDIRSNLKKNEAAIEFISFHNPDIELKTFDDIYYYALVLRTESEYPFIIELGDEKDIQELLKNHRLFSKEIYKKIWQPLESQLRGINTIFVSPTGLLNGISFGGLYTGKHYLCEKYIIRNVFSTKDISLIKQRNTTPFLNQTATLYGGIDFSTLPGNNPSTNPDRGTGFDYLPGSRQEVRDINRILTNMKWTTSLHIEQDATEESFKALSSAQSPELIHISTHGYYFPHPKKHNLLPSDISEMNKYTLSDNPLIRSGLLFSGANYAWKGKEISESTDDGILTGYEISNMSLSNTKLVVLSACSTGLGDITGSEGVYGLQRAFRLAGVESMIVSLWKVPDTETMELMTEFYSQWANSSTIREAFANAQKAMRNKYPDNPEVWAGFVLIE